EHDHVDIRRAHPGAVESRTGRLDGEVRCQFALSGDVAFADTRPLDDPLVSGVDDLGQIVVAQYPLREVTADAEDDRPDLTHIAPALAAIFSSTTARAGKLRTRSSLIFARSPLRTML